MKKLVTTFVAGAAFFALATPAAAAVNSGGRIEAIVGWDHAAIDFTDLGLNETFSSDGIVFGIGAGYDFAIGNSVALGVDIEASESTAQLEFDDGTDSATISAGRDLYAGARITFPVSSSANIYMKAGYTNARISATVVSGGVTTTDSGNADGVRAGLGTQVAIGTNAYIGGEYRYSNYEADFSRHQALLTLGFRM